MVGGWYTGTQSRTRGCLRRGGPSRGGVRLPSLALVDGFPFHPCALDYAPHKGLLIQGRRIASTASVYTLCRYRQAMQVYSHLLLDGGSPCPSIGFAARLADASPLRGGGLRGLPDKRTNGGCRFPVWHHFSYACYMAECERKAGERAGVVTAPALPQMPTVRAFFGVPARGRWFDFLTPLGP